MSCSSTTPGADWPPSGALDLTHAFEALFAGVRDLEAGLYAGELARELARPDVRAAIGPALIQAYEALQRAPRPPFAGARRTETVQKLLEQTRAELVRVERTYPAEFVPETLVEGRELGSRARLRVLHGDQPVLRLDQALSARFWGVAFAFEAPGHADLLARAVLRDSALSLAVDLSDLAKILERIGADERFPALVPTLKNRAFERLMLDILNEEREAASLAPLAQDYSQKTDLRYDTARGLGRQRGARVQVTSLTSLHLHDEKRARIHHLDKIVLLSPIELARFLDDELHGRRPFHVPLERELLHRLWSAIGTPATVPELVNTFGQRFQNALQDRTSDPRGPIASVPAPLRELVRAWVDRSALRSTRLLRAYEDRFGPDSSKRDGRMRHRRAAPPTTALDVWSTFLQAHPPGTIARVRVVSSARAAFWAVAGDGIEVYVMLGAAAEPGPAPGEELDVRLLDASADRRWYTAALPDADPEAVVRGARSVGTTHAPTHAPLASWARPEVRALEPGLRLKGRVVKRLDYGLLVDVQPDLAGLLHAKAMLGRSPMEFTVGQELEVVLLRLDFTARRIELGL